MSLTIEAVFDGKVFVPTSSVALPRGAIVELAVQPIDDVNGDAFGAAGTQHRNDMDYSDSTHDIRLKVAASHGKCRSHTSCRANNSLLEATRGGWRH